MAVSRRQGKPGHHSPAQDGGEQAVRAEPGASPGVLTGGLSVPLSAALFTKKSAMWGRGSDVPVGARNLPHFHGPELRVGWLGAESRVAPQGDVSAEGQRACPRRDSAPAPGVRACTCSLTAGSDGEPCPARHPGTRIVCSAGVLASPSRTFHGARLPAASP